MRLSRRTAGIFLIVVGSLWLADLVFGLSLNRYWPLAFVVIGAVGISTRGLPQAVGIGLMLLGAFLVTRNLGFLPANAVPTVLALSFIGLGVWILVRPSPTQFASVWLDSRLSRWAVMGGVEERVTSDDFQSAELVAVMGGIEVDLTDSALSPGGAHITAVAIMGAVELKVPQGWRVAADVPVLLGALENKTRAPVDPEAPVLTVSGFALMGGISIEN